MKAVKLDIKKVVSTAIAGAIVALVPKQINNIFFKNDPNRQLNGITFTLAGAGAAYLGGLIFKKPDIANAGLGIAAVSVIDQLMYPITGTSTLIKTSKPPVTKTVKTTAPLDDFLRLSEFGGGDRVGRHSFSTYSHYYN